MPYKSSDYTRRRPCILFPDASSTLAASTAPCRAQCPIARFARDRGARGPLLPPFFVGDLWWASIHDFDSDLVPASRRGPAACFAACADSWRPASRPARIRDGLLRGLRGFVTACFAACRDPRLPASRPGEMADGLSRGSALACLPFVIIARLDARALGRGQARDALLYRAQVVNEHRRPGTHCQEGVRV
jgi:hypothetical protein